MIGRWSAPAAVLLSAVIYLFFAWTLVRLPPQPPADASRPRAPLGEAVRLQLGNAFLATTTLMFLVFNIGLGLVLVWLPVFSATRLAGTGYGLLLAAFAAGQMAAALAVGDAAPGGRLGLGMGIVQALAGLAIAAMLPVGDVVFAASIVFVFDTLVAPLTVWAQTVRMAIVPPALHGRTFALLRTLMQAGRPIGGALAGLVIDPTGLGPAIMLSAALVGVPGLLGLGVRGLRDAKPSA